MNRRYLSERYRCLRPGAWKDAAQEEPEQGLGPWLMGAGFIPRISMAGRSEALGAVDLLHFVGTRQSHCHYLTLPNSGRFGVLGRASVSLSRFRLFPFHVFIRTCFLPISCQQMPVSDLTLSLAPASFTARLPSLFL